MNQDCSNTTDNAFFYFADVSHLSSRQTNESTNGVSLTFLTTSPLSPPSNLEDTTSTQGVQFSTLKGENTLISETKHSSAGDQAVNGDRGGLQLARIMYDPEHRASRPIPDLLWSATDVRDGIKSHAKTDTNKGMPYQSGIESPSDVMNAPLDGEKVNASSRFSYFFKSAARLFSAFSAHQEARTSKIRGDDGDKDDSRTFNEGDDQSSGEVAPGKRPFRSLWRRRHARTLEEGIRRERSDELSFLLDKAQIDARRGNGRSYVERTLMGILNVLAEEVEDLDIDINTLPSSPIWRKGVEELRINFSRLGFKPIRMGGNGPMFLFDELSIANTSGVDAGLARSMEALSLVECADEAFDRIDEDKSGTLDRNELAQAMSSITALATDRNSVEELASDLVLLYDANGDGVVDREEYQQMVEDMARISPTLEVEEEEGEKNPFFAVKGSIQSVSQEISKKAAEVASAAREKILRRESAVFVDETEMGSIVLSNLNLDLRRLVFGALPVVKVLTPGGPLILEPFTATVTASFSRDDVLESFLLDAGLRRLVARALRVRVRSFRDIVDGALFYGRRWKMTSKTAPVVEVLGLSNVEFDSRDRMIITGRARIRTSPEAPVVTNTFKVRTKIGTRKNGQVIRLVEPELAFVFECPTRLENGLKVFYKAMRLPPPKRPEPYYSFFPIYSPFKVDDNDGFDMGEDNCIRSIFIRNGKLRFEMSVVLRPGRFLGNHYLAFTLPQRTFIITMDRVWEGIRAARENKRVAARAKKLKELQEKVSVKAAKLEATSNLPTSSARPTVSASTSTRRARLIRSLRKNKPKPKSFFSRFVEGYTMIEREGGANNERLTNDISDWFGRQGRTGTSATSASNQPSNTDQPDSTNAAN